MRRWIWVNVLGDDSPGISKIEPGETVTLYGLTVQGIRQPDKDEMALELFEDGQVLGFEDPATWEETLYCDRRKLVEGKTGKTYEVQYFTGYRAATQAMDRHLTVEESISELGESEGG